MLLSSLGWLVKVWDAVVGGAALGSCQGNGVAVSDGGSEDGRFPRELLCERPMG